MEVWKVIKGYEGLYQVSDLGRVKSLKFGKERILAGVKDKDGYLRVGLCYGGKERMFFVHRLVAEAFIPNPDNLPQVNHRDECKTNNIVTNLEYCDANYNTNYGTRNERAAKARINHPTKSKSVYQYTPDGSLVGLYPSVSEAKRRTGYDQAYVSACCRGEHKTAYGYLWSYTPINKDISLF